MGDINRESLRLSGVGGGFLGHIFRPVVEVCSERDTSQGVSANFGKHEVAMAFLSG
jgi:hypothetical protein